MPLLHECPIEIPTEKDFLYLIEMFFLRVYDYFDCAAAPRFEGHFFLVPPGVTWKVAMIRINAAARTVAIGSDCNSN